MKLICQFIGFAALILVSVCSRASVVLSVAEQAWLEQHGESIKVGVAVIPPYLSNSSGKGEITGVSTDYLNLIEQILDLEFEYVIYSSYGDLIRAAKQSEVDIVFAITKTPERSAYLSFTPVYSHLSNKIFTRKGEFRTAEMADFSGRRFAVPRGTALVAFISQNYPDIELVQTDNLKQAFTYLASGQVDGVGAYASAGYHYTLLEGIQNVSIVGSVGFDYHISFGSKLDQPELNQLLTKALALISTEQKKQIEQRWLRPEDSQRVELETVREAVLYLGIVLLLSGLLVVVFWNRSLKREMEYRKKAQAEVRFLAYHDELTGVYNRQYFLDALSEFTRLPVSKEETTCLLLFGLDSFRALNESLGHKLGDYVLKRVAERLESKLSNSAVVARTGGDEFAVVIRQESNDVFIAHLAELLIREIARPIAYGDQSIVVGATVGIACQQEIDLAPGTLLEYADLALHQAKSINAGGYMFYSEAMGQQMYEREELAKALHTAINTEEFYLMYQPQIDMNSDKVFGFEALARWQHPERGNIPPDEFIALAEEKGMIVTLGDRVLKMACLQGRQWLDSGMEFSTLAVNVSVRQFIEPDFSSKVLNTLSQTGMPANKLELEITESLFLGDRLSAKETMEKLVQQGVRFSIDDFGTGFSSLLYLKELPVSKIKLDRGFVRGIENDNASLQIIKASLHMGQALNMKVIAEGVETEAEKTLLIQLGCDQAQGYYYSRPQLALEISNRYLSNLIRL